MGNDTGIEVPAEVVAALGAGKPPPAVISVNGDEYRSTIAPMGGKYLLPLSASPTAAAAWERLRYTHKNDKRGPHSTRNADTTLRGGCRQVES